MEGRRLVFCAFFVFCAVIRHASSIKCYSCSSNTNEACKYPVQSKLSVVHCDLNAVDQTKNHAATVDRAFTDIFEVAIGSQDPKLPMGCLKQVTMVGGREVIIRGCQFTATIEQDICKKAKEKSTQNIHVNYCRLCDSDYCNNAPRPFYPAVLGALIGTTLLLLCS